MLAPLSIPSQPQLHRTPEKAVHPHGRLPLTGQEQGEDSWAQCLCHCQKTRGGDWSCPRGLAGLTCFAGEILGRGDK